MSFRKDSDQSVERRLKRRLAKYNLDLLKAQRPTPQVKARGGFKIREAATGNIIFGEKGYEFSATIEDIETWLDEEEEKLYGPKDE
jgi:hypothetical protein